METTKAAPKAAPKNPKNTDAFPTQALREAADVVIEVAEANVADLFSAARESVAAEDPFLFAERQRSLLQETTRRNLEGARRIAETAMQSAQDVGSYWQRQAEAMRPTF